MDSSTKDREKKPPVVNPTTRVTVAFPLSKITVNEPSETVVELARLVRSLAETVAGLADTAEARALADDAAHLVDEVSRRLG